MIGTILLLPFLLVSALPKGVMPATTGDGWITVTICTTDGLRSIVLDETGQEVPADPNDDTSPGNHCVFSFLGSDAVAPGAVKARLSGAHGASLWPIGTGPQIHPRTVNLPGARAPPVLA